MGNYEEYLSNHGRLKPRDGERREPLEVRVNAALDANKAAQDARERVEEFLTAYVTLREPDAQLVREHRKKGTGGRYSDLMERDIQEIATTMSRPDGTRAALLLDDLLILLHQMKTTLSSARE